VRTTVNIIEDGFLQGTVIRIAPQVVGWDPLGPYVDFDLKPILHHCKLGHCGVGLTDGAMR